MPKPKPRLNLRRQNALKYCIDFYNLQVNFPHTDNLLVDNAESIFHEFSHLVCQGIHPKDFAPKDKVLDVPAVSKAVSDTLELDASWVTYLTMRKLGIVKKKYIDGIADAALDAIETMSASEVLLEFYKREFMSKKEFTLYQRTGGPQLGTWYENRALKLATWFRTIEKTQPWKEK